MITLVESVKNIEISFQNVEISVQNIEISVQNFEKSVNFILMKQFFEIYEQSL